MSLCKRVGLPWGLPCSEVYLYLHSAAALEVRKWRCVWPIPFCLFLPSQCPLTISSGGELKEHFRDQEEGEKPLV